LARCGCVFTCWLHYSDAGIRVKSDRCHQCLQLLWRLWLTLCRICRRIPGDCCPTAMIPVLVITRANDQAIDKSCLRNVPTVVSTPRKTDASCCFACRLVRSSGVRYLDPVLWGNQEQGTASPEPLPERSESLCSLTMPEGFICASMQAVNF
jgi:hypothetical protein